MASWCSWTRLANSCLRDGVSPPLCLWNEWTPGLPVMPLTRRARAALRTWTASSSSEVIPAAGGVSAGAGGAASSGGSSSLLRPRPILRLYTSFAARGLLPGAARGCFCARPVAVK